MNVAKAILKNIGITGEKEDTESARNNPESTEVLDKFSVLNTAMLAAQSAIRPHTEMQVDSQPAFPVTTRPEEDHQQRPMSRENPRQSEKRIAPSKRNSVIGGRERTFTDRNANSKDARIAQLENHISQLNQTHATELAELHARAEQSEREKEEYAGKLIDVCEQRDQIAKDNIALRACNVAMRSPHGQYPDDENYIQRIKNLNESMKIWVKNAFKSTEHPHLSDAEDAKIAQVLHKQRELESLLSMFPSKGSLRPIYSNSACRIILVRHLISICLYRYIFHPFCFGLDSTLDRWMNDIFQSILTKGYIFLTNSDR
jgi:hypothetical protein